MPIPRHKGSLTGHSYRGMMFQIAGEGIDGAVQIKYNRVERAAPPLAFLIGKTKEAVRSYCETHGWTVTHIPSNRVEQWNQLHKQLITTAPPVLTPDVPIDWDTMSSAQRILHLQKAVTNWVQLFTEQSALVSELQAENERLRVLAGRSLGMVQKARKLHAMTSQISSSNATLFSR
jgi:hypothetical protein